MILYSTNSDHTGQNLTTLYAPIDPKYLYPEKKLTSDGYRIDHLSPDHNDHPFGFGLEELLFNRQEIIDSKIQMLVSEIYQRCKLQQENLYHICLDQCSFRNIIFDVGDEVWDTRRTELERKIIDLEQEKRREQTSYFRDILFLRKELRESLIEKLEDKQKAGLLINQKEELPCNT